MASVTMTVKGLDAARDTVPLPGAPNKAVSRAINKATAKARTEAWAQVKVAFPIKQSLFYKAISILKAGENSLLGKMTVWNKKPTYVEAGGARQLKAGVKVQPRKGLWKTSKDLVLSTSRAGRQNVYKPKGATVETAMAFSAAQMVDDPPGKPNNILSKVQKAAATAYEKELERQMDMMLARKGL